MRTNLIENSLILLIDLKKMESLNPGFLDDELLDCVEGFDVEEKGFWDDQLPSFQREAEREDEEGYEFFESSHLTVRTESTMGFMGS